jgi:hypothetical protein
MVALTRRVGDGRDADLPLTRRELRPALKPFDAGAAKRLGIGHDVRLGDRHEISRTEIGADFDLVLDRPLPQRAEFAGPYRLFLVGELHDDMAARSAGPAIIALRSPLL